MKLPVTLDVVANIFPLQTLADTNVDSLDTQNDLDLLLNWLLVPHSAPLDSYTSGLGPSEPLLRVKAAARSCLRNPAHHIEFVKLWLNSLRAHLSPPLDYSIQNLLVHVSALRSLYMKQASYLALSPPALAVFQKGLNGILANWLSSPNTLHDLRSYVATNHFNSSSSSSSSSPSPSPGSALALSTLSAVGLHDTLCSIVAHATIAQISSWIRAHCAHEWRRPLLAWLDEWVRLDLFATFSASCPPDLPTRPSSNDLLAIARSELVSLRVGEIYDIVCNYPNTKTALDELSICLSHRHLHPSLMLSDADLRSNIVSVFIDSCSNRLLHSGSNTTTIIIAYIKTIKAFLIIDPTGVLLDRVDRSIRSYLRTRRDFVHVVVNGMLDTIETTNPLFELATEIELNKSPISAPIDDLTDLNWSPDPIDALPDFKRGQVSDIIDALVSIAGLTAVFVEEFTKLFADRLLRWNEFDPHHILRQVELLKTRFGSTEFSNLDVMIRDIQQSEFLNRHLHNSGLKLTVLSQMYWSSVCQGLDDKDFFNVPIDSRLESYSQAFAHTKKGRGLRLIPSLGTVSLELDLPTGCKNFTVTPAQAAVINVFDDNMEDISEEMVVAKTKLSPYDASKALQFWVQQGVLLGTGIYRSVG